MVATGGFFSGSATKDKRIAGGFSGYSTEDKKNVINYHKKKQDNPNYEAKSYELDSLKRQTMPGGGLVDNKYFSPKGQEVGQIASATTDLSGLTARNYVSGNVSDDKEGFNNYLRDNYDTDMDDARYKNMGGQFQRILRESYNEDKLKYKEDGQLLNKAPTDTKIAMDNLGGYAAAIGGIGSMGIMGINAIKNTIQNVAPKFCPANSLSKFKHPK